MRFMFVGDSMTIGRAGDFTWRYRMWQHLATSFDGPYEIVGPRTELYDTPANTPASSAYGDPAFPADARRHLAGWGEGWLHMAPVIRETVAAERADILLVSLGLIDLGFYTDSAQTALNARTFIAEARAANPGVRIVLLPVIPNIRARSDAPFAAECDRFNELLAKSVADLDEPSSPLLLASRPESYAIDRDTYDGTHPGPSGEHKLAAAFAGAMHQAWGLGGRYGAAPREHV
ncbi:GDSL-type esterase/lipase family protein [Streptomyces maoxianensis]|uniref:GDSL-type esterase/lipase family protein n=1 Tax=Streptomyces maoxianensis TaxID=1459942 RepID=A0ABV9G804_9ACTN